MYFKSVFLNYSSSKSILLSFLFGGHDFEYYSFTRFTFVWAAKPQFNVYLNFIHPVLFSSIAFIVHYFNFGIVYFLSLLSLIHSLCYQMPVNSFKSLFINKYLFLWHFDCNFEIVFWELLFFKILFCVFLLYVMFFHFYPRV